VETLPHLPQQRLAVTSGDRATAVEEIRKAALCVFVEEEHWWVMLPEALMQNCVPIFLLGEAELPFEEVYQWSHFSVRMRKNEWHTISEVLPTIRRMYLISMRTHLEQFAARFSFDERHGGAFDEALRLLGRRQLAK
jgi:Exostosin family